MAPPIPPYLCHWKGCGPSRVPPMRAKAVLNFDSNYPLQPDWNVPGQEGRLYEIDVPLCMFHWLQFEEQLELQLAYHPSLGAKLHSL